jgi:glutathione S-transferase
MTLKLHGHPLSSFCWKALIALYETGVPFEFVTVNLGDPAERERFRAISPLGKMPALEDGPTTLSESTSIIEHLARRHPALIPAQSAAEVRHWDRMFDLHCHLPMQRLVGIKLRPEGQGDRFGVAQAKSDLRAFYDVAERHMAGRTWAASADFSMADCAAAPALHYGDKIVPLEGRANLTAYLERLRARPSFARVLEEAQPYAHMFPGGPED